MITRDEDCPLILQYSKRIILWGCQLEGDTLFAALGFFNRGLTIKEFTLTDTKKNKIVRVELPKTYYKQSHRGRAQNIYLKVVDNLRG